MSRRRGEISPAQIDRDYPHQVIVPSDWHLTIRSQGFYVGERKLSLAPRHHSVVVDDQWHTIYCFAAEADAEAFRELSGGERFDPKRRRRGKDWANVRPR